MTTFQKLNAFSKKVTDLTDLPSENLSPAQIKSYFDTPDEELMTTLNNVVDGLNGSGWVDTPRLGSKAVTRDKVAAGAIGTNELDPAIFQQPTTVEGVQAKFTSIDASLMERSLVNSVGVNLTNYPRIVPEANDNGRFTRAIAALNYINNTTIGWGSDTIEPFIIPSGNYQLNGTVRIPSTFVMVGIGNPVIEQLLVDTDSFQTDINQPMAMNNIFIDGVIFYKGRHAFYLTNHNEDNTQVFFRRCQFHKFTDYPIYTWSNFSDNHQSTQLVIEKSKFMNCNGVLFNVCDRAEIRDSWVYVDKVTFSQNRAVFVNYKPQAYLTLHNVAGIPTMGTGTNHLVKSRWVDNYGHFRAYDTRFGGEDYGMPIVYQFGGNDSVINQYSPNMNTSIIIRDSHCSAGEPPYTGGTGIADSSVIHLIDKIPPLILLEGNSYINGTPYISKETTFNIPSYLTGFTSKQYDYFNIKIENNISVNTEVLGSGQYAYPQELNKIVNKGENRDKGFRKYSFVAIGTGVGTGFFYLSLGFDPVEELSIGNVLIYGNPTPSTNVIMNVVGNGLYYVTLNNGSFTNGSACLGTCEFNIV